MVIGDSVVEHGDNVVEPKLGTSSTGTPLHYSVGALIERDDKILLIDRANPPLGLAGPAGHVDEGEDSLTALHREIQEEVGLTVETSTLLYEEELLWNECSRGVRGHHWRVYRCDVLGELHRDLRETKSADWYAKAALPTLAAEGKLERVWKYWFEKLGYLD